MKSGVLVAGFCRTVQQAGCVRSQARRERCLTTFFAGTTIFGLSAFYEIIELWDELYFGGHRIWSTRDTSTDLQFDLFGIVLGAAFAYALLKRVSVRFSRQLPKVSTTT